MSKWNWYVNFQNLWTLYFPVRVALQNFNRPKKIIFKYSWYLKILLPKKLTILKQKFFKIMCLDFKTNLAQLSIILFHVLVPSHHLLQQEGLLGKKNPKKPIFQQ